MLPLGDVVSNANAAVRVVVLAGSQRVDRRAATDLQQDEIEEKGQQVR